MLKRILLSALAALPPLMFATPAIHADDGVHCTFGPGFVTIAQTVPNVVGGCLSEPVGIASGDVVQQTTRGQMVWLKANDLATFVDQSGSNATWVLGPFGVQSRPTGQPFSWEGAESQVAGVSITNQPPSSAAACLDKLIRADGTPHVAGLTVLPYTLSC